MVREDIKSLVIATTLIFLIAPLFVIIYIIIYNKRKKRHIEEKAQMKLSFEAEMAKTQFEVQEQTMQTIGADLHDNIGQLMSLTSLTLNSIELDDAIKARQKIDASIDLTLRSIKEMRQLGKLIQGDQLVSLGLPEAIRYEIGWMERSGKFKVGFEEVGSPSGNNPDKDLILFRIVQETINNIIKHAAATGIGIMLRYAEKQIELAITDNGVGFDAASLPGEKLGMGLRNIGKRASIIGGTLNLLSAPGNGTSVTVIIPYP